MPHHTLLKTVSIQNIENCLREAQITNKGKPVKIPVDILINFSCQLDTT